MIAEHVPQATPFDTQPHAFPVASTRPGDTQGSLYTELSRTPSEEANYRFSSPSVRTSQFNTADDLPPLETSGVRLFLA